MAGGPYACGGLANSYTVTGTLLPNVAGVYNKAGEYAYHPYYKHESLDYYLWASERFNHDWYIFDAVSYLGTWHFLRDSEDIVGTYQPQGTATGVATVAITV